MAIVVSTAKTLVFSFNVMFLILGLVVGFIALLIQKLIWRYNFFIGQHEISPPMVVVAVAGAICLVSLCGLFGVVKNNRCLLLTFSGLLLGLFILEIVAGTYAALEIRKFEDIIKSSMNKSMEEYGHDQGVTRSWDIIQHDFGCCGINNDTDWFHTRKDLPNSCCDDVPMHEKCEINYAHQPGCYILFTDFLRRRACQLVTIVIGLSVAQLLSAIITCLLSCRIGYDDLYEAV